jgi:hypothetical protein
MKNFHIWRTLATVRAVSALSLCVSVFICASAVHWLAPQPANSLFSEIWGCVLAAAARLGQRWKGKRALIRFCSCRKTEKFCCTITFLPFANSAGSFFELWDFLFAGGRREKALSKHCLCQQKYSSTLITIKFFHRGKCIFEPKFVKYYKNKIFVK